MKLAEVRCEKRDGVLVPQDITCGADFLVVEQSTTLRGVEFVLFDNVPASGNVRIEIHSEDAVRMQKPPNSWPTERPKGWGLGWRFRVHGQKFICIHDGNAVMGVCPASGNQVSVSKDDIESYGPRAEV